MIRHLNDGGLSEHTGCFVVACATQGVKDSMKITRVARDVTCLRCRATLRFRNHVSRKGWS